MSALNILPVVLCGGDGTRLWPLSRQDFPKQFLSLFGDKSLLQLTFERLAAFGHIQAVTAEKHRFLVKETSEKSGVSLDQILEPCGRDTAAAMALAALRATSDVDLLLFCPADHYIPDTEMFADMVRGAASLAQDGHIVTFGVEPNVPSTSFGYIEVGDPLQNDARHAVRFREKPDQATAMEYVLSGKYLWNAGIFMVRPDVLRDALKRHMRDLFDICEQAVISGTMDGTFFRPSAHYQDAEAKSIDYAVMEKEDRIAVVPFAGRWHDIGSWDALSELARPLSDGNRVLGSDDNIELVNTKDTLVHAANGRITAVIGGRDLVVVDSPDALLVAAKDQVADVKSVVAALKAKACEQAVSHRHVARPWGSFVSIEKKDNFHVKRISVNPGEQLSLQRHKFRSEHWVVVSGTAQVHCDGKDFELLENQSTYIPCGALHRLQNLGAEILHIIEIQTGTYLGEDDIERFEDIYGRGSTPV
ncbi:mannose-1-phosphate guanylyltransferase/mannose-6-phosphate isomerase [Thalassospira sp. MA62]|nr:mannose-1-phosphate guanylyltransferase/mannose-6-phosphate isomerase [Thalassospira sp. MA62]